MRRVLRAGSATTTAVLLAAGLLCSCADDPRIGNGSSVEAPTPPNIIVVFTDDLGYGDLSSYGHPTIRTPNLDQMAAEGQRWTSFYVMAPVCSPSRGALLTGRHPMRTGLYGRASRVLFPGDPGGMPEGEVTLAEALKNQGYSTGMVGKWHLGDAPEHSPLRHGFDRWYGTPYSNDMMWTIEPERAGRIAAYYDPKVEYWDLPIYENEKVVQQPADQPNLTRRYTEEAVRFIREQSENRFFLYVAHSMPHMPLFRSEDFAGHSAAGIYGDVIEEIDWSVGEIVRTLREEGVDRRTLVVFTSDNGPWTVFRQHGGSAGPLHFGKGSTWEGGVRVPGIFWWPGTIEPGLVSEIGAAVDLWPTVVSLAGGEIPTDRKIDGVDLREVLLSGGESPRGELSYYREGRLYAYRQGDFKAHFFTEGVYGEGPPLTEHDPPLLYNLGDDPGEQFNVAERHPEVLEQLTVRAQAHRESLEIAEPIFDLR